MPLLPSKIFDNNIIRPRSAFSKVYGLNLTGYNKSRIFDKKFGAAGKIHWSTPRIRRLERPAHSSRRSISIIQKFNDCLLLGKMRSIIESNYTFGSVVQDRDRVFLERKKASDTYQYIKTLIGLPCQGQRTKTNAKTCKNQRVITKEVHRTLSLICRHRYIEHMKHAKALAKKRLEMIKFRIIQDLMRQKRYRPKSSNVNIEQHYENVYRNILAAKKRKKNRRT